MALRCEEMRDNCIYRYFVAINPDTNEFTSVHVEYRRGKPVHCSNSCYYYTIAISKTIYICFVCNLLTVVGGKYLRGEGLARSLNVGLMIFS